MKTSGHHENSKLVARLIIFPFLLSFLNQPAFAGENDLTPTGVSLSGAQPVVSIPKNLPETRAQRTMSNALPDSLQLSALSPLTEATKSTTMARTMARGAAKPIIATEATRLETLRKTYLAALDLEINGDKKNKDIPGIVGLIKKIKEEQDKITKTDMPLAYSLFSALTAGVLTVKNLINDALNLPAGYKYSYISDDTLTNAKDSAQILIDKEIIPSFQAYQKYLEDRNTDLGTVSGNYTNYKNSMPAYSNGIPKTITDAKDFDNQVNKKPSVKQEPDVKAPPPFPPDSVAEYFKDFNILTDLEKEFTTLQTTAENNLGTAQKNLTYVDGNDIYINHVHYNYGRAYYVALWNRCKKPACKSAIESNEKFISLTIEWKRLTSLRDTEQDNLKKITSKLKGVKDAQDVVSNGVKYGKKNRFTYLFAGSKNQFEVPQFENFKKSRLKMQYNVLHAYVEAQIAEENTASSNFLKSLDDFTKPGGEKATLTAAAESLTGQIRDYANNAKTYNTVIAGYLKGNGGLSSSYLSSSDYKTQNATVATNVASIENAIATTGVPNNDYLRYTEYLSSVEKYWKTLSDNHRKRLDDLNELQRTWPYGDPPTNFDLSSYLSLIPKGGADPAAKPSQVSFPPRTIIGYLTTTKQAFMDMKKGLQAAEKTANDVLAADNGRLSIATDIERPAREGTLKAAKKYQKINTDLYDGGVEYYRSLEPTLIVKNGKTASQIIKILTDDATAVSTADGNLNAVNAEITRLKEHQIPNDKEDVSYLTSTLEYIFGSGPKYQGGVVKDMADAITSINKAKL